VVMWRPRSAVPSLRGVKRRSNPAFLLVPRWIASLALAMTVERQVHLRILAAQPALSSPSPRYAAPARFHAVIARSETTKQSSFLIAAKMDCFASARNDGRTTSTPPHSHSTARSFFSLPREAWGGWHIVSATSDVSGGGDDTMRSADGPPPGASRHPPHATRRRDKADDAVPARSRASLRGVQRRSNPAFLSGPRWIASLALAMTI